MDDRLRQRYRSHTCTEAYMTWRDGAYSSRRTSGGKVKGS